MEEGMGSEGERESVAVSGAQKVGRYDGSSCAYGRVTSPFCSFSSSYAAVITPLWRSRSDAENPSRILRRTMKDVRRRHWGPTCPGAGSAVKSTVEVDSSVGLMKARCDAEIQIDLGINALSQYMLLKHRRIFCRYRWLNNRGMCTLPELPEMVSSVILAEQPWRCHVMICGREQVVLHDSIAKDFDIPTGDFNNLVMLFYFVGFAMNNVLSVLVVLKADGRGKAITA
uniref:PDR_CDR domain-containing protein n=1 Tax=Ascaris lumbricoides TaxID=6252 RepID=A0A0M3IC09_ASCLU